MTSNSSPAQVASANNAPSKTAERIARSGHSYVEDVASHLHNAIDATKSKAQAAEAQVRDLSNQAVSSSRVVQEQAERYIQENPLAALGIAVAAGAILGALLVRR